MFYCVVLCSIVSSYDLLCHVMFYCVVLCSIVSCYVLLCRVMFPDSNIAKNCRCRRTKTKCILDNASYSKIKSDLVEYMSENPYALVNDGSSDCGPSEINPVCVYILDVKRSKQVEYKFCSMFSTSRKNCSKAETLFTAINNAVKNDDLDWDNVDSVGLDNTKTNMRTRNSLRARIFSENLKLSLLGVTVILHTCQQERVVRLTLA